MQVAGRYHLYWTGGVCDGDSVVTIDATLSTVSVHATRQEPCDTTGVERRLVIDIDGALDPNAVETHLHRDGHRRLVGDASAGHRQQHPAGELHPEQRRVLALRAGARPASPSTAPSDRRRRGRPARLRPARATGRCRAAGPTVSAATARLSVSSPASTAASTSPSAVSMPLIPFAASPNSTALSTSVCGAWSVAIASAVPSARAARHASASDGVRSGGLTRSDDAYGRRDDRIVTPRVAVRDPPPTRTGVPRRSTRR